MYLQAFLLILWININVHVWVSNDILFDFLWSFLCPVINDLQDLLCNSLTDLTLYTFCPAEDH